MSGLAERQAELVAALVADAAVPPGFDTVLVDAARGALLRKRAGEVARVWPMLAASFGASWQPAFASWAATRPTQGALRDGWDFASSLPLTGSAAAEYAERQAVQRYDGRSAPTQRRRLAAALRLRWVRMRDQI
jgi:hypothetical protein